MSTVTVHLPARPRDGRGHPRPRARRGDRAYEPTRHPGRPAVPADAATRAGGAAASRPRSARLTRRGRLVVASAVLLLLVVASALTLPAAAGGGGRSDARPVVATRVTVHPGQTMWQIAATAVPGEDRRVTIARIKELNALSSSALEAGQILLVPAG